MHIRRKEWDRTQYLPSFHALITSSAETGYVQNVHMEDLFQNLLQGYEINV